MLVLIRYTISILIWAAIASILLWMGKTVYLIFWALFGIFLILMWLGHMIYKIAYMFNPDFRPIKIVLVFAILLIAAVAFFKAVLAPGWNKWGSTQQEIDQVYDVDTYCPDADLRTVRTIEIAVPPDFLYRWVRQLPEVGSYGWDIFQFAGRNNFTRLVENLPELQVGDRFLIGEVVEIEPGKAITFDVGRDNKFPKLGINCLYGGYYFNKIKDNKTRINMVMRADYDGLWGWFYSQVVIEFGDFFIATAGMKNLRNAAEKSFKESQK